MMTGLNEYLNYDFMAMTDEILKQVLCEFTDVVKSYVYECLRGYVMH
jgi:hypothetical protein